MKKSLLLCSASILFVLANSPFASAGFMDAVKNATNKINQATNQINSTKGAVNGVKSNIPSVGGGTSDRNPDGTCKHRSATCMDYDVTMDRCMDPLKGYRSKVTAELIERKLKTETLTDEQRANLEEDLAAFKEAVKNKTDSVTIAGEKDSTRHLLDISEDDQIEINTKFGKKYQEIMNKCMGADHMGVGHTTEMNYIQDNSEEMAERAKEKKAQNEMSECIKSVSTLRFRIMAEKMEARMDAAGNLSAKEFKDWQADINAVKEAGENGTMPVSPDPAQPTRYMTRLTTDDQMAINNEYATRSQEEIAKCSAMAGDGKIKERKPKSGGLVDHSKSPANHDANPDGKPRKVVDHTKCGPLGAGCLDGMSDLTDCQEEIGGYRWMIWAEKMQAKFNTLKPKLSGEEIAAWREDIGAVRQAEVNRSAKVESADPDNEYRYQDRLTRDEQQAVNQEYIKMYNARMKYCNDHKANIMDHN